MTTNSKTAARARRPAPLRSRSPKACRARRLRSLAGVPRLRAAFPQRGRPQPALRRVPPFRTQFQRRGGTRALIKCGEDWRRAAVARA